MFRSTIELQTERFCCRLKMDARDTDCAKIIMKFSEVRGGVR